MLTESTNNLTYEKLSQDEMQSRGILGRLVGVCADFISPTRNGRKYPEQLWENIFNSEIMKERISNGVCFGELGHPADREETDMEKICICMPEEPKKGPDGKLRAVFDILDTPNGRILKSLCDYGSTLGISSRGSGDLETDFTGQESVNPDTYNCEGFDIVLLPGVKDARLQYVTESLDVTKENKTLRQQLKESINNESVENQKVVKESLDTLGIDLKDLFTVEFQYDTYNDKTDEFDTNLIGRFNVYANTPEQAINAAKEYCDKYGYVIYSSNYRHFKISNDTYKNSKEIYVYSKNELLDKFGTDDINLINAGNEKNIMLGKDEYHSIYENKQNMDESLIKESGDSEYHNLDKAYDNHYTFDDKEASSGKIKDIIEYLDTHESVYEIYEHKTDNGITIFYDDEIQVFESLKEDINQETGDINNNEAQLADDNDMAIANELQEALKLNKKLDEKIINLQEKLSACYAKEMELEEAIDNYKIKIAKLSNKSKENKALTEKLSKLEIDLKNSKNETNDKKSMLHETMQRDAKERKSLKESIERKDNKIKELNEKLNKVSQENSQLADNVNSLTEQLETAHKDNRQIKEKYSNKLNDNNKLIEKYKKIAKSAVDKYIDKQATILGVGANEIKNRLPESYSFSDIDSICESLREYKVNINSLPFNTKLNENVNLTVKNLDSRVLVKNTDDEISDADLKLAERFIK